jgi:hypothetical protein
MSGFSDFLSSLVGNGPANRAAQTIDVARANQAAQLQDEYNRALADPNAGIGLSPAMQQQQENELGNHIRGQMSDQGAGGSGASNDAVTKGVVDYRIAQMGQRQKYLDSLRSAMLTSTTPQTVQPSASQSAVSRFTTQAAGSAANDLFGPSYDPNDPRSPYYNRAGGFGVTGAPAIQPSQPTVATGQSPNDPTQYSGNV